MGMPEVCLEHVVLGTPWPCSQQLPFSLLIGDWAAWMSPILEGEPQCVTTLHSQVELEVPQLCSFVMRTSQCTLKEVYGFNPEGKALMKKTKNSDEFATAMSK